jgi:hypothetical protein
MLAVGLLVVEDLLTRMALLQLVLVEALVDFLMALPQMMAMQEQMV